MAQRILRFPEVKARTGLSRTSIFRFIKDGKFPASVPLSSRAVGWDSEAIDAWIESRIQASSIQCPKAAPKAEK
jgi:prophage regulatory protein